MLTDPNFQIIVGRTMSDKLHNVNAAANSERRYDPDTQTTSTLTDRSMGDWSWKPDGHPGARVCQPTAANFGRRISQMATFRGVPPSAAELYGRRTHRIA